MNNDLLEQIKRIQSLAKRAKIQDPLLGMVEEVGEVAQAINVEKHGKNKKLDESIAEECVDVLISSLELFFDHSGDFDLLFRQMKRKIDRWESRLDKRNKKNG